MLPPPCFSIGMVPGFLQTWLLAFRPTSSILVSSDQSMLFFMVWNSLGAFWQTPSCHVPFTEKWLPFGHTTIKAWLVERCRDGCPSGRFAHLYRTTLWLCQSDHRVLGHLPDQGPPPPIAQFGWAASSRKSLGGFKLLPFKNDGGHCVLGDLQFCRHFLVPFSRSVPRLNLILSRSSADNSFDLIHGLFFFWHSLSIVGPYIDSCVPCQIMSNQLNLPQTPSCRNISRMISENRIYLSSISSLIVKGLNTYVNKVFLFFISKDFSKPVVTLSIVVSYIDWCVPFQIMSI